MKIEKFTEEERRILRASAENRLSTNEHGRWIIEGEDRPAPKDRRRLLDAGYITWPHYATGETQTPRSKELNRASF